MVFRKAEFVTALQATRNATAVKTKAVHGLQKTIKVQLLIFQWRARSPPPPWREKDGWKRLLRRREKLRYSKDSIDSESEFRAVRLSPKARVLYSWFASPVHLVFRKCESTAKPYDWPSKIRFMRAFGWRETLLPTAACCQSENVLQFSLESSKTISWATLLFVHNKTLFNKWWLCSRLCLVSLPSLPSRATAGDEATTLSTIPWLESWSVTPITQIPSF